MIYLVLILLFLIIGIIAFYFISFAKSLSSTNVPYIGTFNWQFKIMKNLNLEKNKKIVDLGCGDGKALRFFEKEFQLIGEGYDINSFAIIYWKILNKIKKSNIKLHKKDFIGINLNNYDYIYVYLFPGFMEKIEDRIFSAKKNDSIIISNSFKFKKHQPFKIIDGKIYLYK